MYVLAAHLITTYSGTEFTSFVEERIFKPPGMNSTTYHIDKAARSGHMSQSFTADYRRIPHQFSTGTTEAMLAGAGGILSSARDMVRVNVFNTPTCSRVLHRRSGLPHS